jgi:hypothetical protein
VWWLVGLLPMVYDQIARRERQSQPWDLVQQVLRRVYVIIPWVMLVIHLSLWHWARRSAFHLADVGPVLFGLTVAATRMKWEPQVRFWVRTVPMVALGLTLVAPVGQLQWLWTFAGETHRVLPVHLAMGATVLTYGYLGTLLQFLCCGAVVSVGALGYVFQGWIVHAWRTAVRFCIDILPTSAIGLGVTAIGAAFVLLGIGSMVSLRRTAKTDVKDEVCGT